MGLLSKLKRNEDAPAAPAAAPDAVVVARTRARRRLIGATVLLAIGVVGFPLLFETQPRPVPVDIAIDIPRRDSAPPLTLPPARPAPATVVAVAEPVPDPAAAPSATQAPERSAKPADRRQAQAAVAQAPRVEAPVAEPVDRAEPVAPAPTPAPTPKPKPAEPKPAEPKPKPPAAESKPAEAAPDAARVVVQVGAYTDSDKLREARAKVERLGIKTYTQVIESEGGKRTRVRVGPFATRADAEKAAARIKASGLPAAILSI